MIRPKLIALCLACLAGVYAVAGSIMVSGGKVLVGADGKALVVADTTTTTTTIPAPENLITNGTFASADGWINGDATDITITTGATGNASIDDDVANLNSYIYQSVRVTNGWTYRVIFTSFNRSEDAVIALLLGEALSPPFAYFTDFDTDGVHTQEIVCSAANTLFAILFDTKTLNFGNSVSNIQLYTVSAP